MFGGRDISTCKLRELREICNEAGLVSSGNKNVLVKRLRRFQQTVSEHSPTNSDTIQNEDETILRMHTTSTSLPVCDNVSANAAGVCTFNSVPRANSTLRTIVNSVDNHIQQRQQNVNNVVPNTTYTSSTFPMCNCITQREAEASVYTTAGLSASTVKFATANVPQYTTSHMPTNNIIYPACSFSDIPFIQQTNVSPNLNSLTSERYYSNTNVTTNVRDIIEVLPEFDPCSETSLSSIQFINRLNQLKDAYAWNEKLMLFAVQTKLKGPAKSWIENNQIFTSWLEFVEYFLRDFPVIENIADVHIELIETKRKYNEKLDEYYYKMLALGRKGKLPDNAIIKYIINGINENEFRNAVSAQNFTSCNELLIAIKRYCSFKSRKVLQPINVGKPRMDDNNKTNRTTVQNFKFGEGKTVTCYNCAKVGHVSIKCPYPQKKDRCNLCYKTTHNTLQCPTKQFKPPNEQTNINKIHETQSTSDVVSKVVKINGNRVNSLIDSGSDRTLIERSFAKTIGKCRHCEIELNGFAGGNLICNEQLNVDIEIDGNIYNTNALVVSGEYLKNAALIGRDILCRNGQRFIIQGDKCWLEKNEKINVEDDLPTEEYLRLKTLIQRYNGCFATNIKQLGKCTTDKMVIKLKTDEIVQSKPYRIAFAKRPIVENIIAELLNNNIIRLSESSFASPIVLVEKKNGEGRLCVDYRRLNKITHKQPYPMPNMEEQFAKLAGNVYFSTLDLKMGYYQIEISEDSKKYTAFISHNGHYEFNRMPFGLVNAPSVFQNVINKIVNMLPNENIIAYLDDIIIPSNDIQSGFEKLEKFLNILQQNHLTLRLDKCKFLCKEITYLGHIVNKKGIRPGEEKLTAIRNFKEPTNITELRRFLGLTGFFRKFVEGYSLIAKPLTRQLRKTDCEKFLWEQPQREAFRQLIQKLSEEPVLALFDFKALHEVHTDASSVGLAGVLLQSYEGKNWKPVFYYSRQCTDVERKYHSYELEVLAVVESLERFRVYILGKHIKLITDCSAITKIKDKTEVIPRVARWWYKLMEYDLEFVHRSGKRMTHVDALSRAPDQPPREPELAGFVYHIEVNSDNWLLTMQLQDDTLKRIIAVLKGYVKDDQEPQIRNEYMLINNRLYRKDKDGNKFVIPKSVRWRITQHCHENYGHFGIEKTIERIKQRYWFPKIRKYVKQYIASCIECCYNKIKPGKPEGRLHSIELEPIPFLQLHLDHLGPFVRSTKGNTYILAVSDAFSKYIIVKAVRNTKANTVIKVLNELTSYFGLPKRIITDRGTAYTAKLFEEYCNTNNIQHVKTATRTPRANGQVERANQTILNFLRTSTKGRNTWDEKLREIQWSVNSQKNRTTGFSPNELVFDFDLRDIIQNRLIAVIQDECEKTSIDIKEKRKQALQHITDEVQRWKKRFDERHLEPRCYLEGDLVLIENEPTATGESRKLESKYRGPYVVKKILGNDRYLLEDIDGMQITNKRATFVFCSDKMRPWCAVAPELNDYETHTDNEDISSDEGDEDVSTTGLAELSRVERSRLQRNAQQHKTDFNEPVGERSSR